MAASTHHHLVYLQSNFLCATEMAEAFALASSIIGVIGFTLSLWDKTSEIRKNGSTISTADCTRLAVRLQEHCDRFKKLQDVEIDLEEGVSWIIVPNDRFPNI